MAGTRITGRFGTVTLGSGVAEIVDWTATFEAEAVPCGIKGEVVEPAAVGGLTMTVTAERIMTDSGGMTLANKLVDHYRLVAGSGNPLGVYDSTNPGPPGKESAFTLDVGAGGGTIVGAGVVTRARVNAPRDLSRDNFEMRVTALTSVS